jgi:hypothetical protein
MRQQKLSSVSCSLVEGEHPVGEAKPETGDTIHAPETTVLLVDPAEEALMGAIAERSVCAHLAVAELVVARLSNIEGNWSQAGNDPLALTIAQG